MQWCGSMLCQVNSDVYAVCSAVLCTQHKHHCGLDTACCHTTAQYITTYIYQTFLTIVTLARLKYKLPDDGHRPKHVGAY